jgi:hypothetical protein
MRVSHFPALLGGLLVAAATPAIAQSRDCPYQRDLAARIELSPGTSLRVKADAGTLVVRGVRGARQAHIQGTVCAGSSNLAQQASIRAEREAGTAIVETSIPEMHRFLSDGLYVRIVEVHDGSGSIEIRGARGPVRVHDGSGDVIVHDVDGDVTIYDGSGSIDVDGARSLVVEEDGSGSIGYANVRGRVDVPRRGRRG